MVKIVYLGGLPEKGDISDWLDAGGTQSDLETLIEFAEPVAARSADGNETSARAIGADLLDAPWNHPLDPWYHIYLPDLQDCPIPLREWIVPDWVPTLETTGLSGPGGEGKTLVVQMLATAVTLGVPWLGIAVGPMKTLLLLCEDRQADVYIRQAAINKHYSCDFRDLGNMRPVPRRRDPRNRLMIFDRDGVGHPTTFFFQFLEQVQAFAPQLVILGGLLVATVLMLIFLPALYVAWFRLKEPAVRGEVLARAHGN
ncbi:MAG: AAA family ATPase [Alphaproteobacteria bacterium]|nr:AAA family ATPase [Alphaproteobacteria bacterium]